MPACEHEPAVAGRDPARERRGADHRVARTRDAAAPDVGEHVRPDVRGDVELFGELVTDVAVPVAVGVDHMAGRYFGQASFSLS